MLSGTGKTSTGKDYWSDLNADLTSQSYGVEDGDKRHRNQSTMHMRSVLGSLLGNPIDQEIAPDIWSDIFRDLEDAVDC